MAELPKARITIGEERHELTPENASIFTFLGKTMINGAEHDSSEFNHVFYQTRTNEAGRAVGLYIFNSIHKEVFAELANFMGQNGYPAHVNMRQVPDCDKGAYLTALEQYTERDSAEIPDFLPDDFS